MPSASACRRTGVRRGRVGAGRVEPGQGSSPGWCVSAGGRRRRRRRHTPTSPSASAAASGIEARRRGVLFTFMSIPTLTTCASVPEARGDNRHAHRVTGSFAAVQLVRGVVQHYAWGDPDVHPRPARRRARRASRGPSCGSGTHPNGPATLDGRPAARRPSPGQLPYLLKVLAAGQPLSLQAHPNAEQARGRLRPRRLPRRPTRSPSCSARSRAFEALCGIRPRRGHRWRCSTSSGADELGGVVATDGPGAAARRAVLGDASTRSRVVDACATSRPRSRRTGCAGSTPMYPGDPSVAATLLLNLVVLEPGQALRLDAGNLHAYLHGRRRSS